MILTKENNQIPKIAFAVKASLCFMGFICWFILCSRLFFSEHFGGKENESSIFQSKKW